MQPRTFRANGLTWFQLANTAVIAGGAGAIGLHYLQAADNDSYNRVTAYGYLLFSAVFALFTLLYLQRARTAILTIAADNLTYRSGTESRAFTLAQATLRQEERGILQRSGDWILESPEQPPLNLSRSACFSTALIEHLQTRLNPIKAEPAQGH